MLIFQEFDLSLGLLLGFGTNHDLRNLHQDTKLIYIICQKVSGSFIAEKPTGGQLFWPPFRSLKRVNELISINFTNLC